VSNKAFLETLARTMSIVFLCLAVVAVGEDQIQKATATQQPNYFAETQEIRVTQEPKRKTKNTVSRSKLASKTTAPSNVTERGIWLKKLLIEAGFEGRKLKEAWAIVMKESTGRPTAHNGNESTGDNSYGIFQINMIGSLGTDRREKFNLSSNTDLFNPLKNAKIAHYMSRGGEDWSSWDIDSNGYNGGVSESRYREWLALYPKG